MKTKFVYEDLDDILKPKQLIGKLFYDEGYFSPIPPFILKILNFKNIDRRYEQGEQIIEIECEVVFNKHLIEGSKYYELNVGEKFKIDQNAFHFKELDRKVIEKINKKISELKADKKYIEYLLNEK